MDTNNEKQPIKRIRISLTRKNQLTLPVKAQKYLGTSPQSTLEIVLENGRAYIEPTTMSLDAVYSSAKPKTPLTIDWQEAEQVAKDEQAEHILDEI